MTKHTTAATYTTSPFAQTAKWQDDLLRLAHKWAATGRPTPDEWKEWKRISFAAFEDARETAPEVDDRIYDQGRADGNYECEEEAEDLHLRALDGP